MRVTDSTRPEPPAYEHEGFHYEPAEEDGRWRSTIVGECSFHSSTTGRCHAPAVARLNRSQQQYRDMWRNYCADHLYGRWVEGGRVMSWRLTPDQEET